MKLGRIFWLQDAVFHGIVPCVANRKNRIHRGF